MAIKKIEQKVTKWWHAFTELKSWVQIVIAVALVVIVHKYSFRYLDIPLVFSKVRNAPMPKRLITRGINVPISNSGMFTTSY